MKKNYLVFLVVLLTLSLFSCNDKNDYYDPRGTDYAGSESCIQCHKAAYENVSHTSHFKATAPATVENVLGNFSPGFNTFEYNDNTKLVMEIADIDDLMRYGLQIFSTKQTVDELHAEDFLQKKKAFLLTEDDEVSNFEAAPF